VPVLAEVPGFLSKGRKKQHEQNQTGCLAQTSYQSQKIRREAQSAKDHWHCGYISSAAIRAALPIYTWSNEHFAFPDIFGLRS
jgi:hypothetical protein